MAQKATNQVRQIYEVRGGTLDFKISTETGLSVEELQAFGEVVRAAESFAKAFPPESAEVRAERLAERARAEEFKG
ncbi:MAG: hypothetical protein R2725_12320 [Solirubrobacterales bacterium]